MDTAKAFISQNGMFLFLTLVLAVSLKHHYSETSSEDLAWILRPTAAIVEHISKIRFEEEAHTGFVNYSRRIIIAPACAGVNFLIIALCMAAFSGFHHMQRRRLKWLWLVGAIAGAYGLTVLVNTMRIILSIYSYDADIYSGWLTPQRMHRLEGVVIYFFFLCLFYRIITAVCRLIERWHRDSVEKRPARADPLRRALVGLVPLFWYGAITLAVPMLNGAIAREGARFAEHGGMVISGCLAVLAVLSLIQLGWEGIKRLKIKRA
ncbi:MAG TPA: exosortase K [Candidatus Binatia bacterium]|nr:exosortase K [Candidatus Binatia bacterium]